MSKPRCTVGLLTWNAGDDGPACAASLLAQTESPLEIDWLDNGSDDGTPERLGARFEALPEPWILPANVGFCAGHNRMLARCRTDYYLALNQDVVLSADYARRLCDWLDENRSLGMVSGLILRGRPGADKEALYSAGLVWPRARFPFELGNGRPPRPDELGRRQVPGVTGAALMLRVSACRLASDPEGEVFPADFFAYHEEVDLALRMARTGWTCGVEGAAKAWHAGQGSGGLRRRRIRAAYFANHWLLTLRHEPWSMIARELAWIARGELVYWLPRYARSPIASAWGAWGAARRARAARRFYHRFEARHGPSADSVAALKARSRELLRRS